MGTSLTDVLLYFACRMLFVIAFREFTVVDREQALKANKDLEVLRSMVNGN